MPRRYTGRKYWIHMPTGAIYACAFDNGEMTGAALVGRPRPSRNLLPDFPMDRETANRIRDGYSYTTYDVHSGAGTQYEKEQP